MAARRPSGNSGGKPVTLRDLAELAGGMHPSTASLALRNHPGISAATRARIQAAARKLGYHRDPLLDAFNARRVSARQPRALPTIALVADSLPEAQLRGAERAAAALFHRLERFRPEKDGLTGTRLDSVFFARRIRGVIVTGSSQKPPPVLAWPRYAFAKIECLDSQVPGLTVAGDWLEAARRAAMEARTLGYRRIGLATDLESRGRGALVRAGYLTVLSPGDGNSPPIWDETERLGRWIKRNQVDAVIDGRGGPLSSAEIPASVRVFPIGHIDHERLGATAVEYVVGRLRMNRFDAEASALTTFIPLLSRGR